MSLVFIITFRLNDSYSREMPQPTEKKLGLVNKEIEVDIPFKDHFTELLKFQQTLLQN